MIFLLLCFLSTTVFAGDFPEGVTGYALNLKQAIPFSGVLLSIALMPLFIPRLWHKFENPVLAFWSLLGIYVLYNQFGSSLTAQTVWSVFLHEYLPFLLLIATLYVISSGLLIRLNATPSWKVNTGFMIGGSFLASLIGTTGAAMLLIRSLIKLNEHRKHKIHVFIFFIFLVANIGGSLTPLGDPPLFLGFLKGVPFFWPTVALLKPFLMVFIPLVILFMVIDLYFFSKEDTNDLIHKAALSEKAPFFAMYGKRNVALLLLVVLAVFSSGHFRDWGDLHVFGSHIAYIDLLRNVILLGLLFLSLAITPHVIHTQQQFNWAPVSEVARVFAAIFITMIPVTLMLKAGTDGAFKDILSIANDGGNPKPYLYFWLTGIFSSFLDNAPTYLMFFHMAGGDPAVMTTTRELTLMAISCGAVFMGAMTYIGNAPNFMVRSLIQANKITMPGFIGYIGWSLLILAPIFLIFSWVLF